MFTDQQQQVIAHKEGGLLVSAAAGSGKTTVMVEQILKLIMDPQHPVGVDRLLVVTFTSAAADSMKRKLEERLSEELDKDPDNEWIAEQIRLIPLASVMTNHAFSLQLVRDYITRIDGIDPGFRIAVETESALMKADVLKDLLESLYSDALVIEPSPEIRDFLAFVNTFGGRKQDARLEETILNVYEYMLSDPEPEKWLERSVQGLDPAYTGEGSLYELGELTEEDSLRKEQITTFLLPAMRGLQHVLLRFDEALRKEKAERNVLDFSDFEHDALTILQDEDICRVLRERYCYIFIDEYQDCNRLQETIIQKIARKNEEGTALNVFMVGDVKQSIYRFRLADPSLFTGKYSSFPDTDGASLICLNQNFRSGCDVIDAVNDIFSALMRKEVGGIPYGEEERLYPCQGRIDEAARAKEAGDTSRKSELIVLEAEDTLSEDRQKLEAGRVAAEIKRLVSEGRCSLKDIVILMRSTKGAAGVFSDILEENGIPVVCETSTSFYDAMEVRTIINLLAVIDNPRQDIPLMGVLYSPIVGLDDEDLGYIRTAMREGDFYEALKLYGEVGAKEKTVAKVRSFLNRLSRWREMASRYVVHDLLWMLYRETGYYLYASAMPDGLIRKANLDLLLHRSVEFEKGSYSGLYQFLRYVEKMDQNSTIESEAQGEHAGKDAVRIMTIHKSKGLEFPVVFLVNLGKGWNLQDQKQSLVLHDRMGIGASLVDPERHVIYGNVKREAIRTKMKEEMIAEEIRLLYVAMTRAKDKLYLVGSRAKAPENLEFDAQKKLTPESILGAKSYLGWIEGIVAQGSQHAFCYKVEEVKPEDEKTLTGQEAPSETEDAKSQGADHSSDQSCDLSFDLSSEHPLEHSKDALSEEELSLLKSSREKLLWTYPHAWKAGVPKVISVSEVKHARMEEAKEETEEERTVVKAPFLPKENTEPSQGALRGTAYHEVMARADISKLGEIDGVESEIRRIRAEGFLSDSEAAMVDREWVLQFGKSDLCRRMLNSNAVYKEQAFVLDLPLPELAAFSQRYDYGGDGDGSVILQGIIDLYFYEGEEIVLADYKTDYLLDEATVEGYGVQLSIYARALESATGKKVKEKFLYDVRRGKEIHC